VAWIGAILKLGCPGRFERLSIVLCLALGWSGLLAYDAVFSQLPGSTICLIVTGGMLYSVGVVFHLWDRLRFQNAIWHAFVVGAAALQFCAVFSSVSAAPMDESEPNLGSCSAVGSNWQEKKTWAAPVLSG
jgi:hemolysin III